MSQRIDHVIIAAPDLDQLEATFAHLGFAITGGGTHPHLGTRNRIVILGDGYIELLGVSDETRISAALRARLAAGGGWIGFALQSADIAAEADAMRARGVDARGPVAGRLVAPDGSQRSWRVVTINSEDLWQAAFPLPFLIQHDSEGDQHRRELAGSDALVPHANGATRLLGITLRTATTAELRARYEHTFGLHAPTSSAAFPLDDSGEWIDVTPPTAPPLTFGATDTMSVTVAARDLGSILANIERAPREIALATSVATAAGEVLRVTLTATGAALDFQASSESYEP